MQSAQLWKFGIRIMIKALTIAIMCGSIPVAAEDVYDLEDLKEYSADMLKGRTDLSLRLRAIKEAALTFGNRAGLAKATKKIQEDLSHPDKSTNLNIQFYFQELIIEGPSGVIIVPPVYGVSDGAVKFSSDRDVVMVSDVEYRQLAPAYLSSSVPTWQDYLLRETPEVTEPPAAVLPRTRNEEEFWGFWVEQGWNEGVKQAKEIFEYDFARLTRDFKGVVLYHQLVMENKLDELRVALGREPIYADGTRLTIGTRFVRIQNQPAFNSEHTSWQSFLKSVPNRASLPLGGSHDQ